MAAEIPGGGRLIVLDDDPTGTQTVRDVPILTRWEDADLAWALDQPEVVVAILTNSRSMPEAQAAAISEDIAARMEALARERGITLRWLSRSDSTLRGHFPPRPTRWRAGCCAPVAGSTRRSSARPSSRRGG